MVEVGGMWQRIWGGDFSRAAAFSRQVKSPWHFPGGSGGKESVCNAGAPGSIPGSERSPLRREWLPTPAFLPGEFHRERSLRGYSPWGHKELNLTEQLTFSISAFFIVQLSHPYMTTGKTHAFDYTDLYQQSDVSAFQYTL